jgi:ankyrin repeat protein
VNVLGVEMRFFFRFREVAVLMFVMLFSFNLFSENLLLMDINDRTGKVHPDVVKGSKEYMIKLLGSMGKYKVLPDSLVVDAKKRSKEWQECTEMECQVEIGKGLKADIVVVPSIDYFAGIFTLTINYIYIDTKRKTEAGATDFNGTAIGMKNAIEKVFSEIHGKKIEEPKIVVTEQDKKLAKYKTESFKPAKTKDIIIASEPEIVPIFEKVIPGSADFSSVPEGVKVTVNIASPKADSCITPCSIKKLNPGAHSVRYEKKGFITKDDTIEVSKGKAIKKSVKLSPVVVSLEEVNNQLIGAVKEGKLKLVKELLAKKADINYRDANGMGPLLIAALSGNKEMAAYLTGRGAKLTPVEIGTMMMISVDKNDKWLAGLIASQKSNLNFTYDEGRSILWYAAEKNAWDVFDVLVAGGVDPGLKDSGGKTVLVWAMENGVGDVVERLKKAGVKIPVSDTAGIVRQAVLSEDIDRLNAILPLKPDLNKRYEDGLTLLWYAVVKKRTDIVSILLKAGADAGINDSSGNSLIKYSVETRRFEIAKLLKRFGGSLKPKEGIDLLKTALIIGDSNLVQILVELGVNINLKFEDGLSALWIAVFNNNPEVLQVLVSAKANLNIKDNTGKSVLMWCVVNDRKELAQILIDGGANINLMDNDKRTALILAVLADKPRMVHLLIKNDAKIDLKDKDGNSPVLIAAARGNISMVELFLDKGAFINTVDSNGNTALTIALHKNFDDIAQMLIEKGADLNLSNKNGETPLIIVAKKGVKRYVDVFLKNGVNIDAQDKNGDTALIHAKKENRREIVFLLLKNGAKIEKRADQDELMAYGTLNSYHEIVENLIERGVSVNRRFKDGLFPLWYAARNGDAKMIALLVSNGGDLEARNKDGDTVLLYAASKREEHVVNTVVKSGANVNAADKNGSTPLMIVSARGFEKAVKLLIEKGANVNAKDKSGKTPIVRAKWTGNYNIVEILKKAGAYE